MTVTGEKNLGFYVAERRKFLGLRQSDLALTLGYTTQAFSNFERGESQISLLVLPTLATLLSLSLDDLLLQKENPARFLGHNALFEEQRIASNLTTLRENHHLSLQEEADKLGISRRTLISYEHGDTLLSLEAAEALFALYALKPSEFFYEKVALTPKRMKKSFDKKTVFYALASSLLGVAIILGFTLPQLLPKAESEESSQSAETSSFFSSTSSFTSETPSSVPDSSSTTSLVATNDDLSPYLPGLTTLTCLVDGKRSSADFEVGDHEVSFDSGSFVFNEANKAQYWLEYSLGGFAPDGISFTEMSTYGHMKLHLPTTLKSGTTFFVKLAAKALSHEDHPVYGTPLHVAIINNDNPDVDAAFPGLKTLKIVADGSIESRGFLKAGSHTLSYLTSPSDYFANKTSSMAFAFTKQASGITLTENTLTIESSVTDCTTATLDLALLVDGTFFTYRPTYIVLVDNPVGEPNHQYFPGLLAHRFYICGDKTFVTLPPGTYPLTFVYEMADGEVLDMSLYSESYVVDMINGQLAGGSKIVAKDNTLVIAPTALDGAEWQYEHDLYLKVPGVGFNSNNIRIVCTNPGVN
jgi:transcriptional regulator with XRE-family HTH domain